MTVEKTEKAGIEIFRSQDGAEVEVRVEANTVWLTQKQLAKLFTVTVPNINQHLTKIYKDGELFKRATVKKFLTVQLEGKGRSMQRNMLHYNLQAIIALGYKVHSARGIEFRVWANEVITQYLTTGAVVNQKIIKQQVATIADVAQKRTADVHQRCNDLGAALQRKAKEIDELKAEFRALQKQSKSK